METLSPEQEHALSLFKNGENLFITGPGGTGKTKLIHHLVNHAKINNITCQVCALTGCASLLLNCGAKTLHSWSGIKLAKGEPAEIVENALKNKKALNSWKKTRILIVDEVSMMSQKIFEIVEEIARWAKKRFNTPFGGMQVVFTGDFFQLPPVGLQGEETSNFCFQSAKWTEVFSLKNHVQLTTMFRQKDPIYANILLDIRKGVLCDEHKLILQSRVKREVPNGCVPTKLFAVRRKVDEYNQQMFSKLNEELYEFHCDVMTNCKLFLDNSLPIPKETIEMCKNTPHKFLEQELNALKNNMPCSSILSLKKGTFVMCLINHDLEQGVCNGSQGVVIDFVEQNGDTLPVVKFTNGVVVKMDYHYWQSEEFPTIAVGQIPLCLAWAMTIHKIQGGTLSVAEIDIGNTVFEYGQAYVALSRVSTLDGLFLLSFHPQKIRANPTVIEFYENMTKNQISSSQETLVINDKKTDENIKIIKLSF